LSDFDSPDAIVKYKSGWIFQIINTPAWEIWCAQVLVSRSPRFPRSVLITGLWCLPLWESSRTPQHNVNRGRGAKPVERRFSRDATCAGGAGVSDSRWVQLEEICGWCDRRSAFYRRTFSHKTLPGVQINKANWSALRI
jgi:hypothetical protein